MFQDYSRQADDTGVILICIIKYFSNIGYISIGVLKDEWSNIYIYAILHYWRWRGEGGGGGGILQKNIIS